MLTTKKSDKPGEYVILAHGRDTGLRLAKGEAAKYGMPQEWEVYVNGHDYLFSARGKRACVDIIEEIFKRLSA